MRCKNCGWDNPDGNGKCEKCGTALDERVSEMAATKLQSAEGTFNPQSTAMGCPKCGYPVRPSDAQCPNCDANIAPVGKSETKAPAPKPAPRGTVIGGIGGGEKPVEGRKEGGFFVT